MGFHLFSDVNYDDKTFHYFFYKINIISLELDDGEYASNVLWLTPVFLWSISLTIASIVLSLSSW